MLRQQTFAPDDREIGVQLGITALRYGNVEVRTIYQFFSIHTQNSAPTSIPVSQSRWNNFIDILDFPKHKPDQPHHPPCAVWTVGGPGGAVTSGCWPEVSWSGKPCARPI